MFLHHLPVEILDDISNLLHSADLAALSRTNSFLYPVAQRLLYRHLSLSSVAHNTDIVYTLAQKPDVAQYVRSFTIRTATPLPSFYHQLAIALSNMSELTSLDVFVDSSASWVLPGQCSSTFPRLLHFACSFPFDSHVAAFLCKTDSLVELEVDSTPTSHLPPLPSFRNDAIPRLAQFVGSSHVATVIVPGRPVESVQLNSGELTESVVECLTKSTAHVAILGATTSSLPVPFLGLLVQHMPYLVYLRMMTTYNFSEAPDVSFYENVADALTSLPDLKAFELSGMHWGSSKKNNDEGGRVWQSKPLKLNSDFDPAVDDSFDVDPYSDVFLAY